MSIWNYREIKRNFKNETNLITLDEGNTPFEEFTIEDNKIYLKREDLNPSGSWKDRGTAYKLTSLVEDGKNEAVIASSGNAAISFLKYANTLENFKMNVVLSPDVNEKKNDLIKELAGDKHEIFYDAKAKTLAAKISGERNIPNLKSSVDNDFVKGYWSLGFEIYDLIKNNLEKEIYIVCPVSSGTGIVGVVEGLFLKIENETKMPRIIMCQTQSCHPLLNPEEKRMEKSLADAIVDKSILRKPQLEKILKQTDGMAFTIFNEELERSAELMKEHNIELSYTSLLSVAGYKRLSVNSEDPIFILIATGR